MPSVSFTTDEARAVSSLVYDHLSALRDREGEYEECEERGELDEYGRNDLALCREGIRWFEGIAHKFNKAIYR